MLLTYSPKLDFTQTSSLFSTEAAAAASHTLPDNLYIKRFVLVRWPLTSNHVIRAVNYRNLSCRVESQKNLCVKMGFWEQICIHTIKFEIGQESSIPEDTHDFVQQCLNQSTNDDSWWCWALNCSLIHWWAEDQALWWALNSHVDTFPLYHLYHHLCGQGRPSMAPYKAAMGGTEDVEEETNSGDLIAMNR